MKLSEERRKVIARGQNIVDKIKEYRVKKDDNSEDVNLLPIAEKLSKRREELSK